MGYIMGAIIFLFGAALGSFINVVADRYNTGLPFLKGRSICFACGARLKARDLSPVFSFLFLRGRCRYCGSKIPVSAFIVEILMGVLSLLAALKSGILSLSFIPYSLFFIQTNFSLTLTTYYLLLTSIFAVILLISVYDLKHFIIPDSFLIFLFFFSFLYLLIFPRLAVGQVSISQSFLSGIVVTLPFLLIFLVSRGRWLGFGDVKYIAVLGFWLGLAGGLSAVILAFWVGAVFSITALFLKKIKAQVRLPLLPDNLTIKSEIPFGPFISTGIIVSFLLNADLFQINSLLNAF